MKGHRFLSLTLSLLFVFALAGCPAPDGPDGPTGPSGKTFTVSYYYDYDQDGIAIGTPDEVDTVAEGRRAVMLTLAPSAEYELEGWYLLNPDGTTGEKWDLNTPVTEDIGLIANWRARDYFVHYFVEGRELWMDTIPYGETIVDDPHVSSREQCERVEEWKAQLDAGKVFLGWKTPDGKIWDFASDKVTYEMELHAVFGEAE